MTRVFTIWGLLISTGALLKGQNVGIGTSTPHSSARLHIESTNSGLLIPRMTATQRDAIATPAHGLLIFNTTSNCLEMFDATAAQWIQVDCGKTTPTDQCPTLANGLIGWWTFNTPTGSTETDLSGNGNHGTRYGSPFIRCHDGSSFYGWDNCWVEFDGIDDYIEIPDAPSLNPPILTLVAWAKFDNTSSFSNAIINKEVQYEIMVGGAASPRSKARYFDAAIDLVGGSPAWAWVVCGKEVPLDKWVFLAITYDETHIRFYMDGELVCIEPNRGVPPYSNPVVVTGPIAPDPYPLRFGARGTTSPNGFQKFWLDEVRLYNRVLSDDELKCLYRLGVKFD